MAQSGRERQARFRANAEAARAEIDKRLAMAERPAMRSEPILLLEGLLDGVLEIAWRADQRAGNANGYADRGALWADMLGRRDLPDVLKAFEPHVEEEMRRDFRRALFCIRHVYRTAKLCTSFATE